MPKSKGNSKSRNKRESKNPYVKQDLTLPPVVHDEPTGPDLINNLNNDCLGRVFQYLSFADKLKIERVCKRWRSLSKLAWENVDYLDLQGYYGKSDLHQLLPKSRNDKGVRKLLKKCGVHVKKLILGDPCDCKIMPIVSRHCQNLKILTIFSDCFNWPSNMCFPQLQKVKLYYMVTENRSFPEEVLRALPSESLTEIDLLAFPCSRGASLRIAATVFKDFTKLSRISFYNFELESDMVAAISEKSTLTSLDMSFCDLKGGLPRLNLLTNLKHLSLARVDKVNDNFLKELSQTCHNLEILNVSECQFTDAGIIHLWQLSKLEELDVSRVEDITDTPLGNLTNLRRLNCSCCQGIHDNGIIELMLNASNLQFLSLCDTAVTVKILIIANEITKERTNNIPLKIWVERDLKSGWNEEVSPLLTVE